MTNAALRDVEMNIRPETSTKHMAKLLRDWADCEERHHATYRARQWRIVADRLEALDSTTQITP